MRIWVNGCFDIIHGGHIDLLWYAKRFGCKNSESDSNILVVGLDSDERVKLLKGDKRPINSIETRKKIMENLKMVDMVVVFNTNEELEMLIKENNIDYMMIGNQYKDKTVIGSEYSKNGVHFYPVDERSTTRIIEKIKRL